MAAGEDLFDKIYAEHQNDRKQIEDSVEMFMRDDGSLTGEGLQMTLLIQMARNLADLKLYVAMLVFRNR